MNMCVSIMLLFFTTYVGSIYGQQEIWEKRDDVDSNFTGLYKVYYVSDVLRRETYYIEGKKNGYTRQYLPNGALKRELNYLNDLKHGTDVEYNEQQEIAFIHNYFEGQLNGYCKVVLPGRKIIKEGFYYQEKKDNIWRYYSEENSELIKEEFYDKGELISTIEYN